ncbi:tellurite resistance TerB family protein [Ancylobacter amanitiformis]|uniref:Uncharacterized membrane protein YebE (DUF533 family) n=1 Tax=Ancylobacter amanitiformis TaxID=217069 RepID=A0ABU0LNT1_9HYPH|nr:tellurite resistance TerB family protein [Ancylobacter amanitiformis]MDQ0510364.1 uncharacterized membrane protein YebE (DUF533 family) [Ancylobacter amanitiformis]
MFNNGNFDAKRLLDQFLGAQTGTQGGVPARQEGGATGGSPLGDLIGGLTGGLTGAQGGVQGGGQSAPGAGGDLFGRAKDYLSGNAGSLATGAAAGGLVSLVLGSKGGRKVAKNAVALGGLALVGTLAYKAYQNYQQGQQPQQAATPLPPDPALPPAQSPFHPAQAGTNGLPVLLLRAMIAAALADGHVDDRERLAIGAKLNDEGAALDEAERFLTAELANPASVEELAREAATPEQAAEVYIAALLTIDADTISERAFLARLASALRLDAQLVPHLDAAARAARQP